MMIVLLLALAISVAINVYLYVKYNTYDGQIVFLEGEDGKTTFSFDYDGDPYDIPEMTRVTFKIVDNEFWAKEDPFAG